MVSGICSKKINMDKIYLNIFGVGGGSRSRKVFYDLGLETPENFLPPHPCFIRNIETKVCLF